MSPRRMTWRNTTPQVFPVRPQLGPWRGKLDLVVGKEDAAGGAGEVVAVEEDVVPAEEGEEAAVTEGGGTEQQNEPTNLHLPSMIYIITIHFCTTTGAQYPSSSFHYMYCVFYFHPYNVQRSKQMQTPSRHVFDFGEKLRMLIIYYIYIF